MRSTRRDFLKTTAAAMATSRIANAAAPRQPDLIKEENNRAGARDWQLTRVRPAGFRNPAIEGYCSHQSIAAGEDLKIMVSTEPASRFTLEIFRMGYYGGRGALLMTTLGPLRGRPQPIPPVGKNRLRQCEWEPAVTLKIPARWPSGVYLGRLTTIPEKKNEPYWQNFVIFIVRDNRPADFLFQCSDNTWQAYNKWPDNHSLYTDPRGAHAVDVAVSFDRPYAKYSQIFEHPLSNGTGEFLLWEFPLAYWMEKHSYDVTYCSNADCLEPKQITRCKTFLSIGHDEYWDVRQYHAVKKAIAEGTHVMWLCGNSVFVVSPFSDDKRVITRDGIFSGLTDKEINAAIGVFTKDWRRRGPDESDIIGARSIVPFNGGGDWTCTKPAHWIYEGTGMKKGESIPGLVGWEHHGAPARKPGLEVVAEGTVWRGGREPAHWTATIYPGPKKNIIFNAATIWWPQALSSPPGHILPWSHYSRPHGVDKRVQQITQNLFRKTLA
ncbi:MAG: hypothetical protein CMO64_03480 [Verrucomicrobiales bacterium]|nr:hypothetical protein [Verrucomicrobiales bacterium]